MQAKEDKNKEFNSIYMAIIVLVVALVAFFFPKTSLWIQTSWINYLLMLVMFGMGLILRIEDFILIFSRPKDVLIGCSAQFIVMPLLAFFLCSIFHLEPALMAGVVLVGTCPGGTASNVITYLSKGDVALSVSMTSINTLLAPLLTPLITYLLLSTTIKVDLMSMFIGIISVILIPIGIGILINKFFFSFAQKFVKQLPMLSIMAICLIVASVVSHNSEKIYTCGATILIVVILHNVFGYVCGFLLGKTLKMSPEKIKALSVEIGMQNSGLAVSIANTTFSQLQAATVPGAIFSVWHNISGAILAGIYRRWNLKKDEQTTD